MSIEALRAALSPAFDPELPPSELATCHTPYAQLTGDDVEGRLGALLESYNRVGVTGPVGCGKTSLARFVADRSPALAPIYLNVAAEDHDKLRTPRGFQELLLTHLAAGEERHTGGELGSDWIGRVASDLTKTLPPRESYRNIRQMAEPANEALEAIRAHDLIPVVVADDTDRLLRLPGEDGEELFQAFFGEVLRSLVDQLHDFALIVAVHDVYRERDDYAELVSGRIEHHLDVPRLGEPGQLAAIFETRATFLPRDPGDPGAGSFAAADVLAGEAIEELHALHVSAHGRSLRRTLATAKGAIGLAVDEPADAVYARHVRAAASDT